MTDMNFTALRGRFTADPEIRRTGTGKAVCSFSLACNRRNDQADFFDCVAYETTAENIAKFFAKGRVIIILGRLQARKWTDREGNSRKTVEIVVRDFYFADSKPKDEPKPAESFDEPAEIDEGFIPF